MNLSSYRSNQCYSSGMAEEESLFLSLLKGQEMSIPLLQVLTLLALTLKVKLMFLIRLGILMLQIQPVLLGLKRVQER